MAARQPWSDAAGFDDRALPTGGFEITIVHRALGLAASPGVSYTLEVAGMCADLSVA
jgi:hypothetical protein